MFANAYIVMKTESPTPRPIYHCKAEIISFLYVSLDWGVELASLLIKRPQSWGYLLKYTFWLNGNKESDKEINEFTYTKGAIHILKN